MKCNFHSVPLSRPAHGRDKILCVKGLGPNTPWPRTVDIYLEAHGYLDGMDWPRGHALGLPSTLEPNLREVQVNRRAIFLVEVAYD